MAEKTVKTETNPIIRAPRVTEKSAAGTASPRPAYTFMVDPRANKALVAKAIEAQYKVKPVKVNIINTLGKTLAVRGRLGKRPDAKKAIVYLKAGDTINLA